LPQRNAEALEKRVKPMTSCRSIGSKIGASLALLIGGVSLGDARGEDPSSLCDRAAELAAANNSVPVQVLLAITRVETGRYSDGQMRPWPWAINLGGEGHWFPDATEAVAFATDQLSQGIENFDVGCFQINLHWHGAKFTSLEQVMDPIANANYAAEFLTDMRGSQGSWPAAVAAYHSRSPEKAAAYLQKVEAVLTNLGSIDHPTTPIDAVVEPRANHFPLLQKGKSGGGGSLVPSLDRGTPLIGLQ
jgi:hypothetical protein